MMIKIVPILLIISAVLYFFGGDVLNLIDYYPKTKIPQKTEEITPSTPASTPAPAPDLIPEKTDAAPAPTPKAATTTPAIPPSPTAAEKQEIPVKTPLPQLAEIKKNTEKITPQTPKPSPAPSPAETTPLPLKITAEPATASLTISGIITLTNVQRQNNGLSPLKENPLLSAAADFKSKDMFEKQYFKHVSPSGEGPAELAKNAGYEYIIIGENLALGNFENDQTLINGWMASPGHRANILNSKYSEIGVSAQKGIYEGKNTWIAVQEFGVPLSACASPSEALKIKIENTNAILADINAALVAMKTELENANPQNQKEYDEYKIKIEEYNNLVRQYNELINSNKAMIIEYNRKVEKFNSCLGQYYE